jgi:hypothetical protein
VWLIPVTRAGRVSFREFSRTPSGPPKHAPAAGTTVCRGYQSLSPAFHQRVELVGIDGDVLDAALCSRSEAIEEVEMPGPQAEQIDPASLPPAADDRAPMVST